MVKLADARDSKSRGVHSPCRFDSDLRHQSNQSVTGIGQKAKVARKTAPAPRKPLTRLTDRDPPAVRRSTMRLGVPRRPGGAHCSTSGVIQWRALTVTSASPMGRRIIISIIGLGAIVATLSGVILLSRLNRYLTRHASGIAALEAESEKLGAVEIDPNAAFVDLKTLLGDSFANVDPEATPVRNEGVATFLRGRIRLIFFFPDCRHNSPSPNLVSCDREYPIAVEIRPPFRGAVYGVHVTDSHLEAVAALRRRFHSVRTMESRADRPGVTLTWGSRPHP